MSENGLQGDIEALLADGAVLRLPSHLTALYEARHGVERRRQLRLSLMMLALGTMVSLVFEIMDIPNQIDVALTLRFGVSGLILIAALAIHHLRPGWQENLVYGASVVSLVLLTAMLGELSPLAYTDRYLLAAIGALAASCVVPPVPLVAAGLTSLSGLAALALAMACFHGSLPLRGNLDLVVFGAGALTVSMVVAVRNEVARRCAFLHALRDEMTSRELLRMNAELLRLTNTDSLTGIDNRRKFEADLSSVWRSRFSSGLGVLIIDVDHFKLFNDSAGHAAGDECLRCVARAVASVVRAGELRVARYGGEEFAVLAEGIARDELPILAERVRGAVEALCTPHPGRPNDWVTISVGAAWCQSVSSVGCQDDLLRAADKALYAAKQAGRNRVALDEEAMFAVAMTG